MPDSVWKAFLPFERGDVIAFLKETRACQHRELPHVTIVPHLTDHMLREGRTQEIVGQE